MIPRLCCDTIGSQKRVTIQRPKTSATPDAAGHINFNTSSNWSDAGKRWATIKTRGGSENYLFNHIQSDVSFLVDLPYDSLTVTIGPSWRILIGTRELDISAAYNVDEANEKIRCECKEAV